TAFFALYGIPAREGFLGCASAPRAEDMRVPSHELRAEPFHHLVNTKSLFFFGKAAIENYLEKKVAQLFFEPAVVAGVDGVNHLVRFLQEQALNGIVVLGAVPWAALGAAQAIHEFNELGKLISRQNSAPDGSKLQPANLAHSWSASF